MASSIFRYMVIPLLWAVTIFFLYSLPGQDLVHSDPWDLLHPDKIGHASVFAGWTVMLIVAFRKQQKWQRLREHARVISLLLSVAYGGALEWIQGAAFEGRTSDPFDFMANCLGAFAGLLFFRLIYGRALTRA